MITPYLSDLQYAKDMWNARKDRVQVQSTQEQLNISFRSLFVILLSMGVCTTGHWQTSGRLVQELNVCTVVYVAGL